MAQQSPPSSVIQALRKLSNVVDALRFLGVLGLCATSLNLIVAMAAIYARSHEIVPKISEKVTEIDMRASDSSILSFFSVLIVIAVTIIAINFESTRKQGNFLFEEISDELQWIPVKKETEPNLPDYRPDIEIRLILRSFVQLVDLPLIPGKFGPVVYVIFNVILLLMSFILPL